ncbi:hypothetical protein CR513_31088, partial [Mucuna pruriens]
MDLKNDKTSNAIKLHVKLPDDIVDELSSLIQIIFRIYYKFTKINYNFKALRSSSKEETILVEANLRKSSIQVPKRLSHSEVISKIPEDWLLEEVVSEPKVYNTQVRDIIQEGSNIRLRMNRSTSLKINEPHMIFRGQPARHSVDSATINLDLRGIDTNNSKVARLVYSKKSESPQYSPTASQEQTGKFREMYYYAYMNRKEINVYFFDWFSKYCIKNIIDYPFDKQISTIGRAEYPPQQGIKIEVANLEIEASPYKDIKKDLDKPVEKIETLNQVENASSSTFTKGAIRLNNDTDLKIEEIRQRLEKLGMDKPSVNTIEINKLKAYPKLRNYYPRPSLVDVQYEERGDLVQNSFSGNEISE